MCQVMFATYRKNRIGILRAVPWSFMVSRVITGVTQIIFPYFMYYYLMQGKNMPMNRLYNVCRAGFRAECVGGIYAHEYRQGSYYGTEGGNTGSSADDADAEKSVFCRLSAGTDGEGSAGIWDGAGSRRGSRCGFEIFVLGSGDCRNLIGGY